MRSTFHRRPAATAAAVVVLSVSRLVLAADDHDHDLGHDRTGTHATHPHFTHPLVTESPLPENQARLDLASARTDDDGGAGRESAAELSLEVALTPNVGLEVALPYVWVDRPGGDDSDGVGNAEVAVKLASYRFGHHGLVLGAGLEVGLPTGDDAAGTGDDRTVELEPYLGFGYRRDGFEMIGMLRLGVPVNERDAEAAEVDLEVAADLSLLYHFTPRVAGIVEFNGAAVVAGASDETELSVNPGVSFDVTGEGRLRVGVGAGVPLTDDAGYDYAARAMVILHF
jgi:hypothetical protein